MGKLSTSETGKYFFGISGPGKVGKTVLASQFPQPFFLDFDQGLSSVRAMREALGIDFDFDVIEVLEDETTDEDFIKLCGPTMAKQPAWVKSKKLNEVLTRKMPKDSTLVVDNLSRLTEYLFEHLVKTSGHRPLQIQDWGMFTLEMNEFMNDIRKAKCNVVFVTHEEIKEDAKTKERSREILTYTKVRFRFPTIVSEFTRMIAEVSGPRKKRRVKRLLISTPDELCTVGSRALIPDIEDPTYEKLKPYLEKSLNRELPPPTWTPPE